MLKGFLVNLSERSSVLFVLVVMCIFMLAIMFPFAVIWAINTLFNLTIAYGLEQYLAVCVINLWVHSITKHKGE